jgi:hypothetical protein
MFCLVNLKFYSTVIFPGVCCTLPPGDSKTFRDFRPVTKTKIRGATLCDSNNITHGLTFQGWVFALCTTSFNIRKFYFMTTGYIYTFYTYHYLRTNSDFFPFTRLTEGLGYSYSLGYSDSLKAGRFALETQRGREFPYPSRPAPRPNHPPIQRTLGFFAGGKAVYAWRWRTTSF